MEASTPALSGELTFLISLSLVILMKVICFILGYLTIRLGYRLIASGVKGEFQFSADLSGMKADLQSVSPGLLFVLLGVILIGFAIFVKKPVEYKQYATESPTAKQIALAPDNPSEASMPGDDRQQEPSPSAVITAHTLPAPPAPAHAPEPNQPVRHYIVATSPGPSKFEYGKVRFSSGSFDKARSCFEEYLQGSPDKELADDAQYYIGLCYLEEGRYAEALAAFSKVIADYPNGDKVPDARAQINSLRRHR
jgi:TolA-binding protein